MKKILNDLKKWLTIWFGIMLMVWIIWWAYASLVSLKVNTGGTLSAQLWNDLVDHSVPSWFVWSFNLTTCPTGWTAFSQANWKFIVWMWSDGQWNTYWLLSWWWEAKHTLTTSELPSHTHQEHYTWWWDTWILWAIWMHSTINSAWNIPWIYTEPTWWWNSHENRPPYLSLLYCVKN